MVEDKKIKDKKNQSQNIYQHQGRSCDIIDARGMPLPVDQLSIENYSSSSSRFRSLTPFPPLKVNDRNRKQNKRKRKRTLFILSRIPGIWATHGMCVLVV